MTNVDEGNPDPFVHSGVIEHTVGGDDAVYNLVTIPDVVVNVSDNDGAGVTIDPSGTVEVNESGTLVDTYTVVLNSQPLSDVTITLSPDAQVTTHVNQLLFAPGNWNTPQTVTVTGFDDKIDEGNPRSVRTYRSDPACCRQHGFPLRRFPGD